MIAKNRNSRKATRSLIITKPAPKANASYDDDGINMAELLSNFALPSVVEEPVIDSDRRFKSRFFFVLPESVEQSTEKRKKQMEKPVQNPVNKDLITRTDSYLEELPNDLKKNIEVIREFFLSNIAPKTVATLDGTQQAKKIVESVTDGDVDSDLFDSFNRMMKRATDIRVARFVAKYMGLKVSDAEKLLDAQRVPQKDVFILGSDGNGNPNQGQENNSQRPSTQRQAKKQQAQQQPRLRSVS